MLSAEHVHLLGTEHEQSVLGAEPWKAARKAISLGTT